MKIGMGRFVIGLMVAGLAVVVRPALAQTASDMSTVYSGVIFSVACFVILVLAGILIRRFSSRRKNDLANDAGLDLMGLRQKNLLTPEEMKMVSAAIARRVAEKDARQKQTGTAGLSTATLLHDPEVIRLQELAQAKRETQNARPAGNKAAQNESRGLESSDFPGDPIAADVASADSVDTDGSLDDVELPPEVQQLADAGILTPEEVLNVKRRLKNRQSSDVE